MYRLKNRHRRQTATNNKDHQAGLCCTRWSQNSSGDVGTTNMRDSVPSFGTSRSNRLKTIGAEILVIGRDTHAVVDTGTSAYGELVICKIGKTETWSDVVPIRWHASRPKFLQAIVGVARNFVIRWNEDIRSTWIDRKTGSPEHLWSALALRPTPSIPVNRFDWVFAESYDILSQRLGWYRSGTESGQPWKGTRAFRNVSASYVSGS